MGIEGNQRRYIVDGKNLPDVETSDVLGAHNKKLGLKSTWRKLWGISKPLSQEEIELRQYNIGVSRDQQELVDRNAAEGIKAISADEKERRIEAAMGDIEKLVDVSIGKGANKDEAELNSETEEKEVVAPVVEEVVRPVVEPVVPKPVVKVEAKVEEKVIEPAAKAFEPQIRVEKKLPARERLVLPEAPIDILRNRVRAGEIVMAYIPPIRRDDPKLNYLEGTILAVGDDNKIKMTGEASNPANFARTYYIGQLEFKKPPEGRIYRKPDIKKEPVPTRPVVKEQQPKIVVAEAKAPIVEVASERALLLEQALNKDYLVLKEYLGYTPDIKTVLTQLIMDEKVLWKDVEWFLDYLNKILAKLDPIFKKSKHPPEKKAEFFTKVYEQCFGDGDFSTKKKQTLPMINKVVDGALQVETLAKPPKPEVARAEKLETRDLTKMFEVALKMDYHALAKVLDICANNGAPGLMGRKLYQAMLKTILIWEQWKPAALFLEAAMQKFLDIFGPDEKTSEQRILMTDFYLQYFKDNNFSPDKVQGLPNAEQAVEEFLKSHDYFTSV
ncbi:MAG: hypothetical protein US42_C0007G0001 [Candidatus Magasanikbacteria bacterium GW2011_GWC2_37_14]|uniref:Uncharacterized protein n=1 Tax=Candidatus Magasanikbacteria bacterium GW2011_GWC2_37_14 TaxID=1619046 RepID=A0A0G0GNA0_9BACT|nr:MAG: hypothetical protein US42_C0007G0001 [Candidatus Magasanikbacteria bacterium GW2011_GWC2_37_14]